MYLAAAVWGDWSEYWGNYTWLKLEGACWYAGVQVDAEAHSATGDCLRTLGVLKSIAVYTGPQPEPEAEHEQESPVIAPTPTPVTQKPAYSCPACGRSVTREEKLFAMEDGRCKACRVEVVNA